MDNAAFALHAQVEATHWWFAARREILRRIIRHVSGGAATAIADVGCGTGGNAAAFAADGHRVIAMDPSPDAIAHARRRFPAVSFVESSDPAVVQHHLAQGGIAVLSDVIEHVADDRALLRGVIDAVPSGGHVVVTVPADPELWSPHDVAFGHFRRYLPSDLSALWRDAPVDVRLLTPFNARLRPVIAAIRRVERGGEPRAGGDLRIPAGIFNTMLRTIFSGEGPRLVGAIDSGHAPYRRGVSLLAVLRRR